MNYILTGASEHQTSRPCENKGKHGEAGSQLDFPALLSTLELRQLVAAMVD